MSLSDIVHCQAKWIASFYYVKVGNSFWLELYISIFLLLVTDTYSARPCLSVLNIRICIFLQWWQFCYDSRWPCSTHHSWSHAGNKYSQFGNKCHRFVGRGSSGYFWYDINQLIMACLGYRWIIFRPNLYNSLVL